MMRGVAGLAIIAAAAFAHAPWEHPKPAQPDTPELAADRAFTAWKAKDAAALRAFAERVDPDPWLVADELCARGEHDAAEAFAEAAPRKDTGVPRSGLLLGEDATKGTLLRLPPRARFVHLATHQLVGETERGGPR